MSRDNNQKDEPFNKVTVLDNLIEAQLLTSILKEQGIPHQIISHHDTAYDGLFQMQKGWGDVNAPGHYHAAIKKIIEQIRTEKNDENT